MPPSMGPQAPGEIRDRKGGAAIDNLPVVVLGLLLGMRHATDPDHVVAVATIVSRQRTTRGAALIGSLWGIGHTVTIMLVGGAIILFDVAIPPRVGLTLEFGVALMLILLGILNVAAPWRRATSARTSWAGPAASVHAHHHPHDDYVHSHAHGHEPGSHGHAEDHTPLFRLDRMLGQRGAYRAVRPLVVGLVHGLAGSAAVALLVLATIRNPAVGDGLSAPLRRGNDRGHDADHRGDRHTLRLHRGAVRDGPSLSRRRLRAREPRHRALPRLPDRPRGRALHRESAMDTQVTRGLPSHRSENEA